ncbi:hypothetical protein Tco_0760485 [Tanacetum coccineum]
MTSLTGTTLQVAYPSLKYTASVCSPGFPSLKLQSVAAKSVSLFAALLPARPAPAESTQQSSHLSGPQSVEPTQPEHQPDPICLQYEPSGTPSPAYVPQ